MLNYNEYQVLARSNWKPLQIGKEPEWEREQEHERRPTVDRQWILNSKLSNMN